MIKKVCKVLNIEDDVYKHTAIKRALGRNGVTTIDWETDAVDGIARIEKAIEEENPYELLITDMHLPVNGKIHGEAGMYVIDELKKKGISIPVAVCSSVRYRIDKIAGCIHYNERSGDLDRDIRELLKSLV